MGFFEIVVIGVIALIVFGPERLPKVIYDVGKMWRNVRNSANQIRQEFENTVGAEIKNDIHNSQLMQNLEENKIAVSETLDTLKKPLGDLPFDTSPSDNDSKETPSKTRD